MQKSGLRIVWVFGLFFLSFSFLEAQSVKTRAYYGRAFYQALEQGQRDQILKNFLFQILSQTHSPSVDQGFDQIGEACSVSCYQHSSIGYDRARQFLMGQFYLYQDGQGYGVREVYCDLDIPSRSFGGKKPGPNVIPDNRVINTEHTWPQSRFTRKFPTDLQKSDLHHLFPTDSELNSNRSSFPFGDVVHDSKVLKCDSSRIGSVIEGRGEYFEPPHNHKGNVARALFYFAVRYQLSIDGIQEKYLRKWHVLDPVDAEEEQRNQEIFRLQGNRNPFIDHPELVERLADF